MIQKNIFFLLTTFVLFLLFGCNKKENNEISSAPLEKPISTEIAIDSVITKRLIDSVLEVKDSKEVLLKSIPVEQPNKAKLDKNLVSTANYPIYESLQSILLDFKIGETKTREELLDSNLVPEEALKIVKNVTKIAENELAIEWKSTWLIEKISDVKFKDGNIKLEFKDDLIYTSGTKLGSNMMVKYIPT